jgi:hypothetical protein
MTNRQTVWNWAFERFVRKAMRQYIIPASVGMKNTISSSIAITAPRPAVIVDRSELPKVARRRAVFVPAASRLFKPFSARHACRHLILLSVFLGLSGASYGQAVQQSSPFVTPGHVATWVTNGVIGDGGAPSGGVGLLGSFVINDMLCASATGTSISVIDCGFSATGTNNWVGLQNLNGGATAPTRSLGDSTTNVATTAYVQNYLFTGFLSVSNQWTALQQFQAGFSTGTLLNIIPFVPNVSAGLDVGGELRQLDNGTQGISAAAIQAQGSGYGNTLTGTMTWSGAGCSINPAINVTTNSGGQIVTVNSVTTPGVCAFQSFPSPIATTWAPSGALSAGTGAAFILDTVITSVWGCSHADGTSRCYASDSPQTGGFNLFNILVNGGMNWGPGNLQTDVSMIRGGVGLLEVNATGGGGFYINSGMLRGAVGSSPTIASGACGTGTNGTIAGTNQSGVITIGAAGTASCTVSFSTTLFAAPGACLIAPGNAAAAATGTTLARVGTPGTTSWVITGSALASTVYSYICL